MSNINIRKVKVRQFSKNVNMDLKYEDVITFVGKGQVVKKEGSNNQDGTENVDYIVKVDYSDVKKADFETSKPVSIVDDYEVKKKSRSQALRHKAFRIAEELGTSDEALYNMAMDEADEALDQYYDEKKGFDEKI